MPDLPPTRLPRYVIVSGYTGPLTIDTNPTKTMRNRKNLNAKYPDFHFRKSNAPTSELNYIVEYGEYVTICSGIRTLAQAEDIVEKTKSAIEKDDKFNMYFPCTRSPIWGKGRNIAEARG